jgi:hypothetical protein
VGDPSLKDRYRMATPHDLFGRNRQVLGGARTARPLNDTVSRRPHGLTGPPRGTLVAEAPRTKKPPKSKTSPKVAGREVSVIASFRNPWTEADEVKAMKENRWEPTSTDFQAVANDALLVDHWHKLIGAILTKGDAESAPGSIPGSTSSRMQTPI